MSNRQPTVLVVGASGALGRAVCGVLTGRGWNVIRGMRTPDGGEHTVHLDVENHQSVADAMSMVDITINTVPLTYTAEKIALETGAKLLSLAITGTAAQRTLKNQYRDAPGTVVLNGGLAPGVTNLVVDELISYDVKWQGDITIAVPLPWNGYRGAEGIRLVHSYFTTSGRHGAYSGLHDTVMISFPDPIGDTECIGWAERDDGWVQRLAVGRMVRAYCYIDNPRLNSLIVRLNKWDILRRLPLQPFLKFQPSCATPTEEPVSIWVSLKTPDFQRSKIISGNGWYLSSARASAVMAESLLEDDRLTARGCLDSNEAFTLTDLQDSLEKCGVSVTDYISNLDVRRVTPVYTGRPAAGFLENWALPS